MSKAFFPEHQCLLAVYFAAIVVIVVVLAACNDIARVHAILLNPRESCKAIFGHDLITMHPMHIVAVATVGRLSWRWQRSGGRRWVGCRPYREHSALNWRCHRSPGRFGPGWVGCRPYREHGALNWRCHRSPGRFGPERHYYRFRCGS